MRILLVEDEQLIARAVKRFFEQNMYSVDWVDNGQLGLDNGLTGQYDVIVLDILLPELDGLSVLKNLRKAEIHTPIIMLTAKSQTTDKIYGLEKGADDYLAKPFEIEELLARIRALTRRPHEVKFDGLLDFGNTTLDPYKLCLIQGETQVSLTKKEAQILEMLILNDSIVITKEQMLEKIWGYETDAVVGNVETQVSLLRKKLSHINSELTVKAIRGTGYLLSKT